MKLEWDFLVDEYNPRLLSTKKKESVLAIGNVQSGKTRFMIKETEHALKADFDIVIILGGSNNLLLEQSFHRFVDDLRATKFPVHDIKAGPLQTVSENYKGIIVSLKHQDSIDKLIKTVRALPDRKFLIFDDESDFGGINTSKDSESEIFKKLRNLYSEMKSGTYVSVTATPYADILSKDGYEFDEYIKLEPNKGYVGVSEFNSSNKYVAIENHESLKNGSNTSFLLEILVDHIKRIIKSDKTETQLLINPSLNSKVHRMFVENINKLFVVLNTAELFNMYFDDAQKGEAKKIIDILEDNIYVLNRHNHDWNSNTHSIIIGGALVSRGYTFGDLLTCILLNSPEEKISCDTLLQRARWFGYREHLEFMKIYLPSFVIKAYEEAEKLNKIIFETKTKKEMVEKIGKSEWEKIVPSGKVKKW